MSYPRGPGWKRLGVFAASAAFAGWIAAAAPQEPEAWQQEIRPLLQKYCVECHGPDKSKAGIRFDMVDPDMLQGADAETWSEALDVLEFEEMPPPDDIDVLPSAEERARLVAWIGAELEAASAAHAATRRTLMRRLTREQYTRTLQELLGLSIDFGRSLPEDGKSKTGFSNSAEVLRASPLHLEYYQSIARDALDQAMALGPRPAPARYHVRLGDGVGIGHVGGRTGGYQAIPLDPEDFRVELRDADGRALQPADAAARAEIERVQRKVTVGFRGSSLDRFHVVPEGVLLYGGLPHREVAPGSWQGPSPNMKLEMQRVFPQRGDFVLRVRASRGYLVSNRKELLVGLDEPRPRITVVPHAAGAAPSTVEALDLEATVLGPWHLAGPIPAANGAEARNTVYVDAPFVDFEAPLRDGVTRWRLAGDIEGQVQNYQLDLGVVILARTIHAPSPRTMEIAVGSDDACWIWVNGETVLARDVQRGVAPDQDFVSVPLAAGRNDLVFKIVNDLGGFGSYHRLIHDGTVYEPAPYTVETPPGARVLLAERSTARRNLRFAEGVLQAENFPAESGASFGLDLPAGYWQFDLVHPALPPNVMGSVRLNVDALRLDSRPLCGEEAIARGHAVTPLGAGFLNAGRRTITLGGPFFVGFSHLVVTPLPNDHPLVARLEAQAEAEQSAKPPALRAFIGTRTDDGMDYSCFDAPRTVHAPLGAAETYEFHGRLENLPIPEPDTGDKEELSGIMVLGVWNDHLVKRRDDPGPPLLIESLEFEAPYYAEWPPASRARIFHDSPQRGDEEAYTREILQRFLPRAFRRPVAEAEVERYLSAWRTGRAQYDVYEHSVRETLVAALCSPSFLFLVEPEDARDGEGRLSEHALAARLSYFLWNAPPDEELTALARAGRLRERLDAQTARLLDDPRSEAFVRAFTREWLRLDRLDTITINPNRFPQFTRFVKQDLAEETWRFVAHVLRENLPLSTLVDSDFAMLNQNLAEFYGIEGVVGVDFRPVPLPPGSGRGGLMGQGAFLAGHSDGEEPHPIKRAVWVKEKLLGQAPKPPPPNVPALDPTVPNFENLTLKERLEKHRDNPSCHDCHSGFDPYGVALETYNAVGLIEATRKGRPVDARTVLPDGVEVDGADGLRAHLLGKARDQVAAAVIEHLFAYAVGRDPDFADETELAGIAARVAAEGGTLRAVVRGVVASPSFRDR